MAFICTSAEHPAINHYGENIGTEPKRALFYSKEIGPDRIYRRSLEGPGEGFELFKFKTEAKAKKMADEINEAYNDDFEPEIFSE